MASCRINSTVKFPPHTYIQAHPLALLHHRELGDTHLTEKIENLMIGYVNRKKIFLFKNYLSASEKLVLPSTPIQ